MAHLACQLHLCLPWNNICFNCVQSIHPERLRDRQEETQPASCSSKSSVACSVAPPQISSTDGQIRYFMAVVLDVYQPISFLAQMIRWPWAELANCSFLPSSQQNEPFRRSTRLWIPDVENKGHCVTICSSLNRCYKQIFLLIGECRQVSAGG